ncbi:MAG: DNA primase catalytic subunit PriS [Candidatus Thermoplasmatota archaeon]|nr:DNA primase catalytic subunit PriS [Candidatus Thermoplasmatota archaeon]
MGPENGFEQTVELQFLKKAFRDHYQKQPVDPPYRFTRREWGFFPFGGKMMFRHIGFQRRSEIDQFFIETAPMHAYYSTAYYGDPALQPMGEKFKTWMGADLIFDLDADHLPNAEAMSYSEQLEKVKEEVKRLLFDFILDDLGLPAEHTHLHFSGGRGYHVHVRAPEVLQMDSRDRRAIVDYITGRGVNFDILFPKYATDYNPRFRTYKERRNFKKRDDGGWIKKIYEGKDILISRLLDIENNKDRVEYLLNISGQKKLDIKHQKCETIINDLFIKGKGNSARRMLDEDKFPIGSTKRIDNDFLRLAVSFSSIDLSGETDEPVTTDIKRLIRCPGSLHGKTGLKVMEVQKEYLKDFDPLRDAVALPDDPIKLSIVKGSTHKMGGENFILNEGEIDVPLYLAYFLIARRQASLSSSYPDH